MDEKKRVTVVWPRDVHRRIKQMAAANGQTMSAFVCDLLEREIDKHETARKQS